MRQEIQKTEFTFKEGVDVYFIKAEIEYTYTDTGHLFGKDIGIIQIYQDNQDVTLEISRKDGFLYDEIIDQALSQ